MATASIPVDLFNPGQVFACLGLMEVAEVLCGITEAGFDWSDPLKVRFVLRAEGDEDPVGLALDFIASAELVELAPVGYSDPTPKKAKAGSEAANQKEETGRKADSLRRRYFPHYIAPKGDLMTLSAVLESHGNRCVQVSHWTEPQGDGAPPLGRESFKLYAGNRSGCSIMLTMLRGKGKAQGVAQILSATGLSALKDPFGHVVGMGGSFNIDARGGWTGLDAGYSPDTQSQLIVASPLVQVLGAIGLQHARPELRPVRRVRYCAWSGAVPPMIARAAFGCADTSIPVRTFAFTLALSGKNKVVTFSKEEKH